MLLGTWKTGRNHSEIMGQVCMDGFVEIISFYETVREHGLSKSWLYSQKRNLSALYEGVRSGVARPFHSCLVPYEEMMSLILRSSRKPNIQSIISLCWTVVMARRFTYLVTLSKGNWGGHYNAARDKGRIVFTEPHEFFALRPRFQYFKDYADQMEPVFSPPFYKRLLRYLELTEESAKKHIKVQAYDPHIQNRIFALNYEEFFNIMLDLLIYGHTMEFAFSNALHNAPKSSDAGSAKEMNTSVSGGIEWFVGDHDPHAEAMFQYDFKNLTARLKTALYEERAEKFKGKVAGIEEKRQILTHVEQDMEIFELAMEGASDPEILNKMGFPCSRQALTSRRHRILNVAKIVFADLRH